MATLLYNPRPSLRPSRALSVMLADMLRDPQTTTAQSTPAFTPAADILETAEGFELQLALPGVKKEAVTIEFLAGELVISGARPNPAAAAKEAAATATETTAADETKPAVVTPEVPAAPKLRRVETQYGAFSRRFRLPETVNVKGIGAELTDGILRLTLPFDTEKAIKQHIEIR
ncbi:Hsp20/alpha crystallin family protein [Hymenobacter sedentarius]|nr:Hsp20/alpha crystallin family protein [Hymenobacter sedentarius]